MEVNLHSVFTQPHGSLNKRWAAFWQSFIKPRILHVLFVHIPVAASPQGQRRAAVFPGRKKIHASGAA